LLFLRGYHIRPRWTGLPLATSLLLDAPRAPPTPSFGVGGALGFGVRGGDMGLPGRRGVPWPWPECAFHTGT
jgi:hypothetical protein